MGERADGTAGGTAWGLLPLLCTRGTSNLRIVCFWNIPFNIFRPRLPDLLEPRIRTDEEMHYRLPSRGYRSLRKVVNPQGCHVAGHALGTEIPRRQCLPIDGLSPCPSPTLRLCLEQSLATDWTWNTQGPPLASSDEDRIQLGRLLPTLMRRHALPSCGFSPFLGLSTIILKGHTFPFVLNPQ